jgi:hypothetical protein
MTWGKYLWPSTLSVLFVAIVIPEIIALVTDDQNTLSYWVWTQLHATAREPMSQWTAVHFLFFGLWLVLVIWLTYHFFLHWWT